MSAFRRSLMAGLMAICLMGIGLPGASALPGPNPPPGQPISPVGPTCFGNNGHYHVWNLFAPQDVYQVDSCIANQLVAARNSATNYVMYLSLLMGKLPAFVPLVVYVMAWHTTNVALANCASKGTGIEFVQDSRTGAVLYCRAQ
jgi:putative hemolysin